MGSNGVAKSCLPVSGVLARFTCQPCPWPASHRLLCWHPACHPPPVRPQLPISDKGLKKLSESFRFYKHALVDEEVRQAWDPGGRPGILEGGIRLVL